MVPKNSWGWLGSFWKNRVRRVIGSAIPEIQLLDKKCDEARSQGDKPKGKFLKMHNWSIRGISDYILTSKFLVAWGTMLHVISHCYYYLHHYNHRSMEYTTTEVLCVLISHSGWNTTPMSTFVWETHCPMKLFLKNCHRKRKHHCTSLHNNIVLVIPLLNTAIIKCHQSDWIVLLHCHKNSAPNPQHHT